MATAIFFILFFIGFGLQYEYGHNIHNYSIDKTIQAYNPTTSSFVNSNYNLPGTFIQNTGRLPTYVTQTGDPLNFSEQDTKGHYEMVETLLARVCRTVNILAHQNKCTDPDDAVLTWNFLLNLPGGHIGSLSDVYSGTQTSTFSCGARDDGSYGRGLISAALPSLYVQNKGYNYDLSGVSNVAGRTDPCGYIELLSN